MSPLRCRAPPSHCRAGGDDARRLPAYRAGAAAAKSTGATTGPALGRMEQAAANADRTTVRWPAARHGHPAAARPGRRDRLLYLLADLGAAYANHRNRLCAVWPQCHWQHQLLPVCTATRRARGAPAVGNHNRSKHAAFIAQRSVRPFGQVDAQAHEFGWAVHKPVNAPVPLFRGRTGIDQMVDLTCDQVFDPAGLAP